MEKFILQITYYLLSKQWLDDKEKLYEKLKQYDKKKVIIYLSFSITILVFLFGYMAEKLLAKYNIKTKKCKHNLYEILMENILGPIIEETGKKIATKLGYGREFVIYDSIVEWILQNRYEFVYDIKNIISILRMRYSLLGKFLSPKPSEFFKYITKNIVFKKYFSRLFGAVTRHYMFYKFHEKGMHNFAVFVHIVHNMLVTYLSKCILKISL